MRKTHISLLKILKEEKEANICTASEEAANYDAKHAKTTAEIARRIEARLDFIGAPWVEDDDNSFDNDADQAGTRPVRAVRLLDYACGTGSMTMVGSPANPLREQSASR